MSDKKIKAYYRVSEFQQQVLDSRNKIFEKGFDIGFSSAEQYMNLKKKSTSYIYAAPFSGKTSLLFDIYIHIAKKYGAKIAIYSPEGGNKEAVVAYMAQVYMGKLLHGTNAQKATDKEWEDALTFIDNHFIILSPKVVGVDAISFTAQELFKQLGEACKEYGWKLDIIMIDPFTMLKKTDEERRKSIADYVLDTLYYINHIAEAWDVHIQIAMHISDTDTIVDKATGVEYTPKPYPSRLHNGQNVWRTGQLMFGMWRLPETVIEATTGFPYPINGTDILVQKNKIMGAGTTGKFRLFYDCDKQKFYETLNGKKYYCGEYEQQQSTPKSLTPSKLF